jgi:hypothetical protein
VEALRSVSVSEGGNEVGFNRRQPPSRGTKKSASAYCHRRLPMDRITRLDGRFPYLRAVSMNGVMQRGVRCYRHYTD